MTYAAGVQTRIDSYLMNLRRSLGELPAEDVNDILREIRGHILERAEASGELSNERLAQILKELGRPEDIGPLYQAEAFVSRARSSFSPGLIIRTTLRWAMMSVLGFVSFILGLFGYGVALGFLITALIKPFDPDRIGAWVPHDGGLTVGTSNLPISEELFGWWIIPMGLIIAAGLFIATTRFLRWMLRFAARRPIMRIDSQHPATVQLADPG